MKISIIGSGWLALPLSRHLTDLQHQVLITTTCADKARRLSDQGFQVSTYQLGQDTSPKAELLQADVLIIAITSKDHEAFSRLVGQLATSTVQHVLFVSSTSVYQNNGQAHDETSQALNHNSPLLKIEQLIQQLPSASIIRFAGLVGPGRHPGGFFRRSGVISNPEAAVNLIHLDDCLGLITAVIEQQAWQQIFNGCADSHPEKGVFYQSMARQGGFEVPQPGEHTTGSDKVIDNQKIKQTLNYSLHHPDVMKMTF